jgi:hypothetical protein
MQANRDSIMKPAAAALLPAGQGRNVRHEIYGTGSSAVGVRFMFRS